MDKNVAARAGLIVDLSVRFGLSWSSRYPRFQEFLFTVSLLMVSGTSTTETMELSVDGVCFACCLPILCLLFQLLCRYGVQLEIWDMKVDVSGAY